MEFKQVGLERLPEIVEVNRKIFDGMYDWSVYELEDYKKRLENIDPIIFIAEEDGKIIGDCISFEKDGKFYLWISGVLKEYRKQGIVSKLFDLREEHARKHGYKKIFTKVYSISEEMLKLMNKRGYKIIGVQKNANPKYNANILELSI